MYQKIERTERENSKTWEQETGLIFFFLCQTVAEVCIWEYAVQIRVPPQIATDSHGGLKSKSDEGKEVLADKERRVEQTGGAIQKEHKAQIATLVQ